MVTELYDALRKAGVDAQLAKEAARAVPASGTMADWATKADLAELKAATRADLAELKADVIEWNVGAMAVLTAIFAAITRLT